MGVVLVVPLVFSWRTVGSGDIKNVVLAALVLSGIAVWLVHMVLTRRVEFTPSILNVAVLSYWGAACLSVGLSQFPLSSAWAFWRISVFVFLYLLVSRFVCTRQRVLILLAAAGVTALAVAGYAYAQKFGYDPVRWSKSSQERVFASIGHPNMLAGYLIMIIPLSIGLAWAARSWQLKALGGVVAAACFPPLMMTLTKAAWLGSLVGGAVLVGCFLASRPARGVVWTKAKKIWLAVAAAGVVTAVAVALPGAVRYFGQSLHGSTRGRVVFWQAALDMFGDHPVTGTGIGTFQVVFPRHRPSTFRAKGVGYNTMHTHSEYLETLAEQGVIGAAALAFLIGVAAWVGCRGLHRAESSADKWIFCGLLSALAGILTHSIVSVILRWSVCPTFFWIILGLLASMGKIVLGEAGHPGGAAKRLPEPTAGPIEGRPGWPRGWRLGLAVVLPILVAGAGWAWVVRPFQARMRVVDGEQWMQRRQWKAAIGAFKSAIGLDRTAFQAYYKLGGVYYEQGKYGKALETLHALQRYAPDYVQVHYNLGITYAALHRWDEAGREFTRARATGTLPSAVSVDRLLARLESARQGKEDYGALLEGILLVNPEDKRTWNKLGAWQWRKKRLDEAERSFQKALEVDHEYVPALSNLAGINFVKGRLEKAIELCERILAVNPKEVTVHVNLGRAYFEKGDRPAAAKHWRAALALNPNLAEVKALLRRAQEGPRPISQDIDNGPS